MKSFADRPVVASATAAPKPFPTPLLLGAAALIAAAGGLVLFEFNPAQSRLYPLCLFHQMTGLECPGCGSLRAMHQLLHGNVVAAFHYNALLLVSLPLLFVHGLRIGLAKMHDVPAPRFDPRWLWAGLVVLTLFGILRNLPFSWFAWMTGG